MFVFDEIHMLFQSNTRLATPPYKVSIGTNSKIVSFRIALLSGLPGALYSVHGAALSQI